MYDQYSSLEIGLRGQEVKEPKVSPKSHYSVVHWSHSLYLFWWIYRFSPFLLLDQMNKVNNISQITFLFFIIEIDVDSGF